MWSWDWPCTCLLPTKTLPFSQSGIQCLNLSMFPRASTVPGSPGASDTRGFGTSVGWEQGACRWRQRQEDLPDNTVYLRASCATMFARPLRMVSSALPSSIRYLASQARQYCSQLRARAAQGALKVPGEDTGSWVSPVCVRGCPPYFPDRGPLPLGDGQEAHGVYSIHTIEWRDLLMGG